MKSQDQEIGLEKIYYKELHLKDSISTLPFLCRPGIGCDYPPG